MSEKPQYPPLKSPMMVDGQISAPWARYFQHVVTPYFERLLNLEDMEILDWSNNRQKDHQRRIEDIERLIHEVWKTDDKGVTKRLEDLENALQFVDGPKDATLLKRLDALEVVIFGLPRVIERSPGVHIADASVAHAITDPADAPATADILRDDLVANAIPEIKAALDALGTIINAILARMEAHGLNHSG